MADAAKRLVGPMLLTTANAVLYTVPSNTTAIIRSIHVTNVKSDSPYTFNMSMNAVATAIAGSFFFGYYVGPSSVMDWSGFLVLGAGETLQGLASAASALNVVICGVEVS